MKNRLFHLCLMCLLIVAIVASLGHISLAANELPQTTVDYNLSNQAVPENPYNNYDDDLHLGSPSAILLDGETNKILYEKNAYQKMYPASTTKAMTAIIVVEKCDLNATVVASYYATNSLDNSYSVAPVKSYEELSVNDLLNSMMIGSANDSAYVLAQYVANNCNNDYLKDNSNEARDKFNQDIQTFSNMMNEKAKSLGCKNTHFTNPNGVPDNNHYSTAYDLALIGKYGIENETLKNIVATPTYTLPSTNMYYGADRQMKLTNSLLNTSSSGFYQYANGFKTGFTDEAALCLIATAKKINRYLICVVLHNESSESNRETDCKKLFEYGFNNYSYTNLIDENRVVTSTKVFNGKLDNNELDIVASKTLSCLIKTDRVIDLSPNIRLNILVAPVLKGQKVGTLSYTIDDEKFECDLIASRNVEVENYYIYLIIILSVLVVAAGIIIFIKLKR